jgi:6,7-dimethyl-8-ribityllumazine synthase
MRGDIDESSENVLDEWSRRVEEEARAAGVAEDTGAAPFGVDASTGPAVEDEDAGAPVSSAEASELDEPLVEHEPVPAEETEPEPEPESDPERYAAEGEAAAIAVEPSQEHAIGELEIPDGYAVLEGYPDGSRRSVGVVVARFNGGVTSQLLARALEELDGAGVPHEAITLMVVPGAFELPIAATALAKTRRFACIVALGCVIRGDTPHFDYVAGEAASGLQLAALETGVPVSFGVLTLDRVEQAEARVEKGAEAVRTALEMADVFSHLRAAAAR